MLKVHDTQRNGHNLEEKRIYFYRSTTSKWKMLKWQFHDDEHLFSETGVISLYIYTYICAHTCMYAYIYTYKYTHTHTHIYIYTNTYTDIVGSMS